MTQYSPTNTVFSVPYRPKGNKVVGRDSVIQAIRQQLIEGSSSPNGQTAALYGLGGLGKTQIAVEYAYSYREQYPNGIIWINADQDIDAQLVELADKALWIAPNTEHKYKLQVAQQRIRAYSDCLIVFDNLKNISDIESYLPDPTAAPHIIVTSLNEQPGFIRIDLKLLDEVQSVSLLVQESNRPPSEKAEWEAINEIAAKLDGLPLALELAGAYLRLRPINWGQYSILLKDNLRAALPGRFLEGSYTKHKADLYSTLKINEDLLSDEPHLKDILNLLTWSGAAPMSISLICALLNIQNPVDIINALSLGTTLRLLTKSSISDRYSIHNLVREVRREDLPIHELTEWANDIVARVGEWFQLHKDSFRDLLEFESEIDHLRAWQSNALTIGSKRASRLTWLQAYSLYQRGRYIEAKKLVENALELFDQEKDTDRELKAHLTADIGNLKASLGDYDNALRDAQEAYNIRLNLHGEDHIDTIRSYSSIGNIHFESGHYAIALEHNLKALEARQRAIGDQHVDTINSHINLGRIYDVLGHYDLALDYAKGALRLAEELSAEPQAIANAHSVISSVYMSLRRYELSLNHAYSALNLRRELFGDSHPDTAASYGNTGIIEGALGKHKVFLEYAEKALKLAKELFGREHPDTSKHLNNVAVAHLDLRHLESALSCAHESLEVMEKLFGEGHTNTITPLTNISTIYMRLPDYDKALVYANKALTIQKHTFGERHPDVAMLLSNLGSIYMLKRDPQSALDYFDRSLELRQELLGSEHPATAISVSKRAEALIALNRRPEAFNLLQAFLNGIPRDHIEFHRLNNLLGLLSKKAIKRGFRQPPRKNRKRKKK